MKLSEKYPSAYDAAIEAGRPSLARVMTLFEEWNEAGQAIGRSGGNCLRNFLTRPGYQSTSVSEAMAREYLNSIDDQTGTVAQRPDKKEPGDLIMVMVPSGKMDSVTKALQFIGCEFIR